MEHETRRFAGSTDRCHLGAGSDRRLHDQRINMSQSTVPFEIIRLHGGMDRPGQPDAGFIYMGERQRRGREE